MTLTCPKCSSEMRSYERNQVVVDQCTGCGGLFLDRGELERLTAAEAQWHATPQTASQDTAPPQQHGGYQKQHGGSQQHHGGGYQQPYRKKKSFLSELFDG